MIRFSANESYVTMTAHMTNNDTKGTKFHVADSCGVIPADENGKKPAFVSLCWTQEVTTPVAMDVFLSKARAIALRDKLDSAIAEM